MKSPFKAFERTFKVSERTFKAFEQTFKAFEQTFKAFERRFYRLKKIFIWYVLNFSKLKNYSGWRSLSLSSALKVMVNSLKGMNI